MIFFDKDPNSIVTLTLDMPGRTANLLDQEFLAAWHAAIERLTGEADLTGVIVTSAKESFLAGADLDMLFAATDAAQMFAQVEAFKADLRRLETLGKPVVAALNGSALCGGLEVALACHFRIALDKPEARFGLPEVTLGLMPGGDGITRLTRLIGLQAAIPFLTEGTRLTAREAEEVGIVHDLADSRSGLMAKAEAWILGNPDAGQPWDRPGYRMPGGDARSPKLAALLPIASAMLRKRTFRNYPAPEAILSAAVEGTAVDVTTASRIESRYFADIATGQTAKNMINAFWYQLGEIKGGRSRPPAFPQRQIATIGVLGAGLMGHGIAHAAALSGKHVVLKDITLEQAEAGKARIARLLDARIKAGRMGQEDKKDILDRISTTVSAGDLRDCELVIEAVFEDRTVKEHAIQEAAAHLAKTAIIASNTSTIPITGLATASGHPASFVGLHFFSPVHKMKLVEIIRGAGTTDATLAAAFDFVLALGKLPIVVNDRRGFYTSRVFGTYVNEGMALLAEGQDPRAVESAGMQAGMPTGPLAVSDEVSLRLLWHIREQTRRDLLAEGKETPPQPGEAVLNFMMESGRTGKAQGAGFYEYPATGRKFLWPELRRRFVGRISPVSQAEMIDRLMFVQVLEAVRCFAEGVVTSVADANIGSIFGWGFAPFKGGTLQFVNDFGVQRFVERSQQLAGKYGARFEPPELLVEMGRKNTRF